MAERARVSSVEALETFRASLIVYLDKAGRSLDEIADEVKRTRAWLEQDRKMYWKSEHRKRSKILEMKQQELFSAQIGGLSDPSPIHRAAVRKAKQAVEEAEEKLRLVQRWSREFDALVEPKSRHVDQLRHVLKVDMGKGVNWLTEAIKTLSAYAEMTAPSTAGERRPRTSDDPSHEADTATEGDSQS
jgi:hypothetical protein